MLDEIVHDITALGGLPLYLLVLGVLFPTQRPVSIALLYGLVLAYGITLLFRACYFKERPDKQSHHTFFERLDASSFPSLHTMRATILAGMLGPLLYPSGQTLLVLAWILASGSRVYLHRHDTYDVLGGIAFGAIILAII